MIRATYINNMADAVHATDMTDAEKVLLVNAVLWKMGMGYASTPVPLREAADTRSAIEQIVAECNRVDTSGAMEAARLTNYTGTARMQDVGYYMSDLLGRILPVKDTTNGITVEVVSDDALVSASDSETRDASAPQAAPDLSFYPVLNLGTTATGRRSASTTLAAQAHLAAEMARYQSVERLRRTPANELVRSPHDTYEQDSF